MSKPSLVRHAPPGRLSSEAAAFYSGLHDGMHAMAQPITLLRSYFYLAQAGGSADLDRARLLDDAAAGVEQLCALFRIMQELVHVQSAAAHLSDVPFSSVLASLGEDAEVVLAGTGLQFSLHSGRAAHQRTACMPVVLRIDLQRTRQAMLGMLHIAAYAAQRESVIRCSFVFGDCWAELILELETPAWDEPEAHFDEVTRLHLALVKANSFGQRAIFGLKGKPFTLSIKLPLTSVQV